MQNWLFGCPTRGSRRPDKSFGFGERHGVDEIGDGDAVIDAGVPDARRLSLFGGGPRCAGRMRGMETITEPDEVKKFLARLALPTEALPSARAREPTGQQSFDFDAA